MSVPAPSAPRLGIAGVAHDQGHQLPGLVCDIEIDRQNVGGMGKGRRISTGGHRADRHQIVEIKLEGRQRSAQDLRIDPYHAGQRVGCRVDRKIEVVVGGVVELLI